jgi:predicted nucleic acid-binding protein
MHGRVLLDTNIIIAFFSGEKAVSQRFADNEIAVPSTVLGELYYGTRKSAPTPANLTRIDPLPRRWMWYPATRSRHSFTGALKIV